MTLQKPRIWGPLIGVALGLFIAVNVAAFLGKPNLGWGALGLIYLVIFVGAPALLALIGFTVFYATRKPKVPPGTFAWMWVPPLAALAIVPIAMALEDVQRDRHGQQFPPIQELHVNLSGRDFHVDREGAGSQAPMATLGASEPHRFAELTRYPGPPGQTLATDTYQRLYADGKIKAGVSSVRRLNRAFSSASEATDVPLKPANPYPKLDDLRSAIASPANATLMQFFHYADRSEAAPAIWLSGSQSLLLETTQHDLVQVHLVNLGSDPIVRMEINGQAVALSTSRAAMPVGDGSDCRPTLGHVRAALKGAWQIRWQTAKPPHAWQETVIVVPAFTSKADVDVQAGHDAIHLFATPQGPWWVQRARIMRGSDSRRALRFTAPPSSGPCTGVGDIWDLSAMKVLSP